MKRTSLSVRTWVLFVAFALQNAEETLFLPGWLAAQRPEFDWPGPAQYGIAAVILTLMAAGVVLMAWLKRFTGFWVWPLAILAGALLVNAGTHLLMSVANFSVMPGVVTGLIIQLPASLWLLTGLVQAGRIRRRGIVIATVIGAAITPFAVGISLRLSQWLLA